MKTFFYVILFVFSFQPTRGQIKTDSIIFHGNIVNDGMANWFGSWDGESLPPHFVYIKHCPHERAHVGEWDTRFSIKCMRGDTLIMESFTVFPFGYKVEFVANDTIDDIHICAYPATSNNWFYAGEKYKTVKLSSQKEILTSELIGTYKYLWEDVQSENFAESTLKLQADGIFEMLGHSWSYDYVGTSYYVGKWDIKKDTVVCRIIPELYPPLRQERYPGQVLFFSDVCMEYAKYAEIRSITYKFLIRKRGLIKNDSRKGRYKKVKLSITNNSPPKTARCQIL